MAVRAIPSGVRGFDCNFPLSATQSKNAFAHGHRFVARYVPRVTQASHDLTAGEVRRIMDGGLGLTPVQHVEQENWSPTAAKGRAYGQTAGRSAEACEVEAGTNVWLDLEGVLLHTDPEIVIQFCNYWHDEVAKAGYLPGIYIGWQAILTPSQQFRRLKFTRYWSAYNLNADLFPAVVGACMKQYAAHPIDYPAGWDPNTFQIDTDIVTGDANGRFPMMMTPPGWAPCPSV